MQRFSRDRLRDLAGAAVFARGEAYHAAGAVSIVTADADEVVAQGRGGDLYRVQLHGSGADISGACSCPAFADHGWCKHLVAAALAADGSAEGLSDRRGAIRAHLVGLGAETLARMLLELAEDDPALMRRLDLAASAAAAPMAEHAGRLRRALREALTPRRFVGYGEAGDWAAEVLDVLDQVPSLIAAGAAADAKALLETVLDDLPEALEQVDDSGGQGTEIIERTAALHLEACRALRPDPVVLAEELFERAETDDYGSFDRADETYADLLGDRGLAEYRRLTEAAYARLPAFASGEAYTISASRRRLTSVLDRFAERDGDVDRRIALRRAALGGAQDYLHLAQFCLSQGRPALALKAAEDGAWLFEDHSATALIVFLAERLAADGRAHEAITALWCGFERTPAFALFQALTELGAPDAADRALGILRARQAATGKADRWRHGALVELELSILMATARLPEAWEVTRRDPVSDSLLLRLAEVSETALPAEAAAAY